MVLSQPEKLARRERQKLNTINVSWGIQNFTMLTMKSFEAVDRRRTKKKVGNHQRKLLKSSNSNGEPDKEGEESLKFTANSSHFLAL